MQQNRTWIKPWLNPRSPVYHVLACYVLVSLTECSEGDTQDRRQLILDAFCAVEAGKQHVNNVLGSSPFFAVPLIMIEGGVLIRSLFDTTAESWSRKVF